MIKRSLFLFVVSIFINQLTFGQDQTFVFKDTSEEGSWLTLSGFNYYSSNRFNNDYMDKWIFGGEITQEFKDRSSERLSSRNSIGAEFENEISFHTSAIHPFKLQNWGLTFGISDNHYISSNIPQDLFDVAMYGNAPYLGDTLNFNFGHFQYQHFQKFGIGMYDRRNMSSIRLSYVSGSKTINGRLGNSWMLNEEDSIQLALQGSSYRSEKFSPYMAFQGSGFAFDLDYNFIFENKKGSRQIINFKVKNLGIIFWNQNSYQNGIDSLTTYSGIDIRDFLNSDDSLSFENFSVLDTLGLKESQGAQTDFLSPELVVQKLADQASPNKLQAIFGFKAILSSDYFPYFYAGGYFKATDNFSISSRVSYGGFGGVKVGLNANYWAGDKVYLGLGTYDLLGNISKTIGYGRGFNLTARFKL
ncbi:MAG: hypothetical protein MI810_07735 [Flavobacteriales bacterium]|nr:hypothetical protein [Flavobacteriales bacterium]